MAAPIDLPRRQKAILQSSGQASPLPLQLSDDVAVPILSSPHDILVRVLAVALNHCDYKMPINFLVSGGMAGCDFCGVIVAMGREAATHDWCGIGTRVCGGVFPYGRSGKATPPAGFEPVSPIGVTGENRAEGAAGADTAEFRSGAFAEYVTVDSRLVLGVPTEWSDFQGAALGAVGWGTVGLAISDPEALAIDDLPSAPASTAQREPVLVYGGATATGTMACQLLKLGTAASANSSGHKVIAVTSPQSASLAIEYGASATVSYTSPTCAADVRALALEPIRRAFDCITSAESAASCFAAVARTGGRYACVESFQEAWRSRRAVRVKEVMGYEGLGRDTQFEDMVGSHLARDGGGGRCSSKIPSSPTYTRKANPALAELLHHWASGIQCLLSTGSIRHHPFREVEDGWNGILKGLCALQKGEVRREKLVIRIAY
ncbi:putative alcohol dehydrogenase [Nemania sp. FL0031]|nr:putative alcohol dehydrogenase [Nemania sp. FL0031]